jgi:hypothetical protein
MISIASVATQLESLTLQKGVGGGLHLQTLRAITAPPTIDKSTLFASIVEATFDGYAPIAAVAFGSPYIAVGGTVVIEGVGGDFIMTGTTTLETIVGMVLTDAGGTTLQYSWIFDQPIVLTQVSQGWTFNPLVQYGS